MQLSIKKNIFMWLYQVFSCSMQDLVPWPGIEPRPPALGTQSLSHWNTGKVPQLLCLKLTILVAVCGGGGCWRPSSLLLGLLWADIFLISSSKLYKTIICSDKGTIEVAVCWSLNRVRLFVTPWTVARQALLSWDSQGKNVGVGSYSFLQGIFLTQGSNVGLSHWRQILCH